MIDKLYRALFFEIRKAVCNSARALEAVVNNYINAVPRWYGLVTSKVFRSVDTASYPRLCKEGGWGPNTGRQAFNVRG